MQLLGAFVLPTYRVFTSWRESGLVLADWGFLAID